VQGHCDILTRSPLFITPPGAQYKASQRRLNSTR